MSAVVVMVIGITAKTWSQSGPSCACHRIDARGRQRRRELIAM
jgi:hypothetical protein